MSPGGSVVVTMKLCNKIAKNFRRGAPRKAPMLTYDLKKRGCVLSTKPTPKKLFFDPFKNLYR